jgi:hypothetical protein
VNENSMRNFLKERYPHSTTWARRVDRMSYEQVVAIYLRMQGEEEPVRVVTRADGSVGASRPYTGETPYFKEEVSPKQLTLF